MARTHAHSESMGPAPAWACNPQALRERLAQVWADRPMPRRPVGCKPVHCDGASVRISLEQSWRTSRAAILASAGLTAGDYAREGMQR